jgi:hypothetical protein
MQGIKKSLHDSKLWSKTKGTRLYLKDEKDKRCELMAFLSSQTEISSSEALLASPHL